MIKVKRLAIDSINNPILFQKQMYFLTYIEMTVKVHPFFRLHGNGILNCFYNNNVSLSNSSYDFKTDKYIWMIVVLTVTQNIGRLKKMIDFFL